MKYSEKETQTLILLKTLKEMYPNEFTIARDGKSSHLTRLAGSDCIDRYLNGELSFKELFDDWAEDTEVFREEIKPFRLY